MPAKKSQRKRLREWDVNLRSRPFRSLRPHRLARLGHYPFTVRTGVRIPVGTPFFEARNFHVVNAEVSGPFRH
jgi:hypothetical protein